MVVALLAVVGYVALKPTYTADEVTERMQTYLKGKGTRDPGRIGPGSSCSDMVRAHGGLASPHYIPYRKAWLITIVNSSEYTSRYAWLFDDRTGTIASSNGGC